MRKQEIVFILQGYWNTWDVDGTEIIVVSYDIELPLKLLNEISKSRAAKYIKIDGCFEEEHGDRYYEIIDNNGRYAKFYIMEKELG